MTTPVKTTTDRACARCGTPLTGQQKRYCSRTCAILTHNHAAPHGTSRRYHKGCRCNPCKAAKDKSNAQAATRHATQAAALAVLLHQQRSDDPNWRTTAHCRDSPLEFVPGNKHDAAPTRAVCASCPVRRACLDYGIATRSFGVWGGYWLDPWRPKHQRVTPL